MAKVNINDFEITTKRMADAQQYISSAEDILYQAIGHLDWRIVQDRNNRLNSILDKLYDQENKCNNIINYCNTVINSYQSMESIIENKLKGLAQTSVKLGELTLKAIQSDIKQKKSTPKLSPEDIKRIKLSEVPKVEKKKKKKTWWQKAGSAVKGLAGDITDAACDAGNWVASKASDAVDFVEDTVSDVADSVKDVACDVGNWVSTKTENIVDFVKEIGERTCATICNFSSSFTWGIAKFGEGLFDGLNIIGTGIGSLATGAYDAGGYIYSKISGDKFESKTKEMWKNTMAQVSEEFVGFYQKEQEESEYGDWLKDESYAYKGVNQAGETIGQITGAIVLSVATAGLGTTTAAGSVSSELAGGVFMGTSSLGKSSEKAWDEGANIIEGLLYGGSNAILDGVSYFVGAKLGKVVLGSGTNIASKLGTVGFRIGTDSLDGFISSLSQIPLQKIYKDEGLSDIFKENGGWQTVLINTAVAGGMSTLSTVFDLKGDNLTKQKAENIAKKQAKAEAKAKVQAEVEIKSDVSKINNIDPETDIHTQSSEVETKINTKNKIKKSEIMKNSSVNKKNLIEGIVNEIPDNLDNISKIRAAYLKLSQATSYSDEYFAIRKDAAMKSKKIDIYNRVYDIRNIGDSNKIVCSNWSQIYNDILIQIGIDQNKVKIITTNSDHKYVTIDIGKGKTIVADATENFGNGIDLAFSKIGTKTKGFKIMNTVDVDNNFLNSQKLNDIYNSQKEIVKKSEKVVSKIDSKIGYDNSQYKKNFDDVLSIYNNKEIDISIDERLSKFKTLFDNKSQSAIEAFPIMRKYADKILGGLPTVNIYVKDSDVIDIICVKVDNANKYLVKINGSNLELYDNIDNIKNGAKRIL